MCLGVDLSAPVGAAINGLVAGDLSGVWAADADDLYVVGGRDLFHFDGLAWSRVAIEESPFPEFPDLHPRLRAVWGRSPSDVWAIGPDGGYHFDGTSWSFEERAVGEKIAGALVGWWSVDELGKIVRYDGSSFPPIDQGAVPAGKLEAIAKWPARGSDVFVGGDGGTFARLHDGRLERMRAPRTSNIKAVFAVGDLIYVAGSDGALDVLFFEH